MAGVLSLVGLMLSCLLIGVAIGAVGIGGVLLVPLLTVAGGFDLPHAIAIAMACFLCTGAVGVLTYGRQGHVPWDTSLWLCAAAAPAAFVGALAVHVMPPRWLFGGLSLALAASAVALVNTTGFRGCAERQPVPLKRSVAAVVGAVGGIGSSLTGTGGPLVVLPILVSLGLPVLRALGLSQASQLPIAFAASAGHISVGRLDSPAVVPIAVGLAAGVAIGAKMAHMVPDKLLRRILAVAVLVASIAMLFKAIL